MFLYRAVAVYVVPFDRSATTLDFELVSLLQGIDHAFSAVVILIVT